MYRQLYYIMINETDLVVHGFIMLYTEFSLSLSPMYGLLSRSEFPYVNFGLLFCFKHALYNLYNFRKIVVYVVTQSVEALRYKSQVRELICRWVHWNDLFLPAILLHWVQLSL